MIGYTNHQAVEFLKNAGPTVNIKFERYLRGPKYEQLQQAIKANELRPPSPPSPTISSLPKIPLSLVVSFRILYAAFESIIAAFYTLVTVLRLFLLFTAYESFGY